MTVVILPELLADGLQFRLIRTQIHGSHGIEIRGVKPRSEDRVLNGILCGNSVGLCDGGWRDHRLRFHVGTNVGLPVRCLSRSVTPEPFLTIQPLQQT